MRRVADFRSANMLNESKRIAVLRRRRTQVDRVNGSSVATSRASDRRALRAVTGDPARQHRPSNEDTKDSHRACK